MKTFIKREQQELENPIFPPMSLFNFQRDSEWMENKRRAEEKGEEEDGFIIIAGFGGLSVDIKGSEDPSGESCSWNIYMRMSQIETKYLILLESN